MDLNSILIGSADPARLRTFYAKLFGEPGWEEQGYSSWQLGSGWLTVGPHDQVSGQNPQPGRLIWNLETADVKSEFDRLREAGASVVAEPYSPDPAQEMTIATLSDPDGNYFQLMSPFEPTM